VSFVSTAASTAVVPLEDLGADLALMARLVQSQLMSATTAFFRKDVALARTVIGKDDQVDNLLGFIEEKCFERIAGEPAGSPRSRRLRGVFRVALDLEKLGDYAVNVAEQAVYLSRLTPRPIPFDLASPVRVALEALDEVITAFRRGSAAKAKDACRCEAELDRQYREALAETFRRLRQPERDPAFLITNLFVAKFLERIGDSILNIGETTLFILTGERLKLHQYLHLEALVGAVAPDSGAAATVDVRQIWGGISGARVGRIDVGPGRRLIWKEGDRQKIEAEIQQMQEWNRLVPGLVPAVEGQTGDEGRESFVGRFLDGAPLRDIYLTGRWEDKLRATTRLLETLRHVWLVTREKTTPAIDYVQQIRERLPDLYAMHPRLAGLRGGRTRVFGISHRSLDELLGSVAALERQLAPPVSVRLHGDFNTNNIVYDTTTDRVHFIDVHRSGAGDYVQDVGVLLVSNLRQPLHDARIERELARLNRVVEEFATEFARQVGDPHFRVRLMLSEARSYITSARLVTDLDFARDIYLQGVRLLERIITAAAA
jgi:phosphate uptake regulator